MLGKDTCPPCILIFAKRTWEPFILIHAKRTWEPFIFHAKRTWEPFILLFAKRTWKPSIWMLGKNACPSIILILAKRTWKPFILMLGKQSFISRLSKNGKHEIISRLARDSSWKRHLWCSSGAREHAPRSNCLLRGVLWWCQCESSGGQSKKGSHVADQLLS
ncbi:hypothetical protein LINPERHAP1_LOCUS40052 [Linum perenne]